MSENKFKPGDRVKIVYSTRRETDQYVGKIGEVLDDCFVPDVRFEDGKRHSFMEDKLRLVEPEAPKGTLDRLQIEAAPQGGYTVIAPGNSWGAQPTILSAHTTMADALAFVGRNMR